MRARQSPKHSFVAMPFHFKNGSGEEGGLLVRSPEDTSMEAVTGMEAAIGVKTAIGVEAAIGVKVNNGSMEETAGLEESDGMEAAAIITKDVKGNWHEGHTVRNYLLGL